ncbi:unnamed protein product [Closterium sp. Naga37s-1]|nr:unnamed protein product [Closterium sp. Naga37s-1]
MQPRKKDSRISDSSQASVVKASKPQSALSRHGRAGGAGSADSRGDGGGGGSQGSSLQSGREKSGRTGVSFRSAFSVVLVFVTALSIAVFAGRRIASRHEARIRKDAAFPVADLPIAGSRSGSTEGNGQLSANRGDGAISVDGRRSNGEASGGVAGGDGDASAAAAAAEGRGIESGAASEDASNEDAAEAGAKDDEAPLDVDKYLLEEARKLMEGMEQQQQQESEEETDAEQRAERARLMDGGAVAGERDGARSADRFDAAASGERDSAAAGASGNPANGNDGDATKVQLGQEQREQEGGEDEGEQERPQQQQQQEQAGVIPVRVGDEETGIGHVGGGGGGSRSPTLNGTSSKHRTTRRNGRKGSRRRRQPLPPLSETCDLYTGRWVRDSRGHPLYSGSTCQFPLTHWTCRRKDRPSFLYEQYRWQPEGCKVPRFNRSELKERLRNKKVAFVGDSVGLQQFFSFLCLISPTPRTHEPYIESRDADYKFNWTTGWRGWQGSAYRFPETNTTVVLKWTTSLCHVARKDWANESAGQAAHLDQPDEFLKQHMEEMDVIIMNTGHHWNINKMQEYGWHFHLHGVPVPPDVHKEMEGDFNVPMRTVLRSTALWTHRQLQAIAEERERMQLVAMREGGRGEGAEREGGEGGVRALPLVLLVTRSPAHFMDGQWNTGGGCDKLQSMPTQQQADQLFFQSRDWNAEAAVEGTAVRLLNITALSALRPEAHLSRWYDNDGKAPGQQDCCLPSLSRSTFFTHPSVPTPLPPQNMLMQEQVDQLHFQSRDWNAEAAVEGTAVRLLNITALSALRPEAHLSRWYDKDGKAPGQQDCVHWCLPGVPDAWNELLFWEIVRSGRFPLPGEAGERGDRGGSNSSMIQDM